MKPVSMDDREWNPRAPRDTPPAERRGGFLPTRMSSGSLVAAAGLLFLGVGAWFDLSTKVALQGQRLDTWVSSLSTRQDATANNLAQHVALPGHPVSDERQLEALRRIDHLETQVAELERQRERLRKAALIERVQTLQRKLQAVQVEQRDQKQVVEHVQEVAEHPGIGTRIRLLFGLI